MPTDPPTRFGPRRSNPTEASAARVYDFLLGGTYNYAVDVQAATQLQRVLPFAPDLARINRRWVQRVVGHLAHSGVRQFLDIGSGIPTAGNVHEIVQGIHPSTRVVYVDYERVAVDIGLELLETNPNAVSIHADMREPETILAHPDTRALLDFTQPIALIWGSMLHFIEDKDNPFGIFDQYKAALSAGDYIALSHLCWEHVTGDLEEKVNAALTTYNTYVSETLTVRDLHDIQRFFEGSAFADPGLVPLPDWRPGSSADGSDIDRMARSILVGGVGRLE